MYDVLTLLVFALFLLPVIGLLIALLIIAWRADH